MFGSAKIGAFCAAPEPDKVLPVLLGAGALLGIPASLIAARLADRHGIVEIVRITAWMMASAAICCVLIAFNPQILGPAATGWIITGVKISVSPRFAYTVAFGIAAGWFILSAALIGRVRLAQAA